MLLVLEQKRDVYLKLVVHAEALFVNNVCGYSGGTVSVGRRGQHFLVFRKRLFGDLRERQIEFAAGPMIVAAETPQVGNKVIDLVRRKQFAESRHDLREAARRPAMDNHVFPHRVRLGSGLIATREIGKSFGTLELGQRLRRTPAVGSMTGNTSRLVKALAILNIVRTHLDRLRPDRLREEKGNPHKKDQDNRGAN